MADNVTWILDHHPGAKMVIWAHNGHVAKAGFPGETTMGAFLRRSYGNRTMTIGSVFNEGSFQAMTQGDQSALASKPFLVPPAPPGSLDATLAAARLPLFALSLRDAPAWFDEPHESREIGATYSEGQPYGSMVRFAPHDAFDALFFVERTSAAKQNPRQTFETFRNLEGRLRGERAAVRNSAWAQGGRTVDPFLPGARPGCQRPGP
jgi:erythromycin esterase